jgi:hypothetical protein
MKCKHLFKFIIPATTLEDRNKLAAGPGSSGLELGSSFRELLLKKKYYRGFPLLISEVKMQLTKVLSALYDAIKDIAIKLEMIHSIICSLSVDEINAHFSEVYNKYFLIYPSL